MAVHNGTAGSVVLVISGTASVDAMDQWTANFRREEVTWQKFGSTYVQRKLGAGDVTGSFRGHWDQGDTNGQVKLKNAYAGGSMVLLKLYDTASNYWSGSAYLMSINQVTPQQGMVSAEFTFSGDGGAWTYS